MAMALAIFLQCSQARLVSGHVDFRGDHSEGARCDRFIVGGQFPTHDLEACDRLLGGPFRDIDQVQQKRCAFDMTEELESEPLSFMGALDDSWYVRDGKAFLFPPANDSQIRRQRGEGLVGDLRPCC